MPKIITVGEFKAQFAAALDAVRAGKTIVVAYGRKRTKVAALVPYSVVAPARARKLGVLATKGSMRIGRKFRITDSELFGS
jgi:antitoxin (DNA-binding transcriptional repressor) of toxin-antitoxin stability system